MVQGVIVILVFVAASVYLGWLIYESFQAKSCASGCGKCGVIDVDKIASEIDRKNNRFPL